MVISMVAWLPLLLLTALQGQLLNSSDTVPFLFDVEVHVRLLLALPLLLIAETLVHQRMGPFAQQFIERHLVPARAMAQFESALASTYRLRDSWLAEVLLLALVYGVGVLIVWRQYVSLDIATWYAIPSAGGPRLSLAGKWYAFVSVPIFQFLLCRWYFRLFIWARLLWRISRITLSLVPTHPDRVGGLGFVGGAASAFGILALAAGVLLAGQIANRIFYLGATLTQFKAEIAAVVVLVVVILVCPLLVFATQLAQTKRTALREYGSLSGRYVREFEAKWLRGGASEHEALVGSADIQSLADLGNSYAMVANMRVAPIETETVIRLGAVTLAPVGPLLLTMMPLDELVKMLFGILF